MIGSSGYRTLRTQDTSVPKTPMHETLCTQCQLGILRHFGDRDTPTQAMAAVINYMYKCSDTSVRILWVRSVLGSVVSGSRTAAFDVSEDQSS